MTTSLVSNRPKESCSCPDVYARTRGRRMDPRDATMDSTDPRRKQHRIRLARLPTTLLSSFYRYSGRLHGKEKPYPTKNEVPRHRLLYSRLRANRPKSTLPPRVTRDEPTVLGWSAKRCSRGRNAISHAHHLPRTHREGPH